MPHTIELILFVHINDIELERKLWSLPLRNLFLDYINMLRIKAYFKVEPIAIPVGISVRSQIQVILIFGDTDSPIQIPTFEVRIKPDWAGLFLRIRNLLQLFIITLGCDICILWILKCIKTLLSEILVHLQRISWPETSIHNRLFGKGGCIWRRICILLWCITLLHSWQMSWYSRSCIVLLLLIRQSHLLLLLILKLPVQLILFITKCYYWRYLVQIGGLFIILRFPPELHIGDKTVHSFLH